MIVGQECTESAHNDFGIENQPKPMDRLEEDGDRSSVSDTYNCSFLLLLTFANSPRTRTRTWTIASVLSRVAQRHLALEITRR